MPAEEIRRAARKRAELALELERDLVARYPQCGAERSQGGNAESPGKSTG